MTSWTIDGPRELTVEPVRRVLVRTVRGSVNVVGSDAGRPRLEVTEVQGRPLRVRHEAGSLVVTHDGPWWWPGGMGGWLLLRRWTPRAVISLAVPRDCPVEVHATAASVVVSGLRQRVAVHDISGDVTLAGLGGEVRAKTVAGTVEAEGIAGDLRLDTVSGDLTVLEGPGGTVHAQTVSGGITLDLRAAEGSDIRLTSVSGDVTIRLPHRPDLQVQLHSTSGQIASAFADLRRQDLPGMRVVQGALGGGVGRLWANTTSGHVALLRREPDPDLDRPAQERS